MININIGIDGPSGSGKSTVAKIIAKQKNYVYVDTGAMYRATGMYLHDNNVDLNNEEEVKKALDNIDMKIKLEDGKQFVILQGVDVTEQLRTQEVGEMGSRAAVIGCVREKLVDIQQSIAKDNNVVMDGRDVCTVVLKDAQVKIYLDASVDARTNRRINELTEKGITCDYDTIYNEIKIRDDRDMNRELSPLVKADDSIYIDASDINIEEVVQAITEIIDKTEKGEK